jgi:hypothetical protein
VKLHYATKLLIASAIALCVLGCSSGTSSGPTPPSISVSFLNPPVSSLNISTSTGLIATVMNDNSNAGVTWKTTCGSASCGTISPASTASGATATYTSPSTVPTPATVTITATSVTDNTKFATAIITITATAPPPPISVSFVTQPPSSMVINTTTSVAASVSNDAKNGGVNWTVTCGSVQCGSFNPTATASGATAIYTAPSAVPTLATVTVTATSVTDKTKSTSATITILATPPPILADGNYVFHFSGQDNNNNYYVAGAFTVKGGVITGGEQDVTDYSLGATDPLVASNCSISMAGNNIQVVLATADTSIGVNGVETLRGTVVSGSRVLVSEFDSFAAAIGSIDLQTSTAPPALGYAFSLNGLDNNSGNPLVIGGVLNFNGTSLSTANSVFDINDGGIVLQAQSFASGSISAPDSFGRVTMTLMPGTSSVNSFTLAGYLVDGKTIQLVESQTDALQADLGGPALAQVNNTGTFSQTNVVNTIYVHGSQGADTNGPLILGGYFNFAPNGSVSGALTFNDLVPQNISENTFSGATFTVSPTGRVTISNVIPSSLSNISLTFQLYLDGNGNALELGADPIEQTTGLAYQQNGLSDYEGNYAVAVQGFLNGNEYEQPFGAVGPVTISSDIFSGYTDYTSQGANLLTPPTPTPFVTYPNTPLSGQEANSQGRWLLTGLNSVGFSQTSSFGFYPIDGNRVLAIEDDGNAMGILMLENTNPSN